MKKFRFRLERVLQYREILKNDKLRELLLLRRTFQDASDKLKELEAAQLMNSLEEHLELTAHEVELLGTFRDRLVSDISTQRDEVVTAEDKVAQGISRYIESAKDAETLSTLKQKKREEYLDYVEKENERFLDELAVQKGNTMKVKE